MADCTNNGNDRTSKDGVVMTKFEVIGRVQGKSRARTFYNPKLGRSQSITPENTVLYENLIKLSFQQAENKETFFNGEPVAMCIEAYYKIPKSTPKKKAEDMKRGLILPTKKPDADNIAKVICDALNGVAYHDDSQIASLEVNKFYTAEEEKVVVYIMRYR